MPLDLLKVIKCNKLKIRCSHSKLDHLYISENLICFTLIKDFHFNKFLSQHSRNNNNKLIWILTVNLKLLGPCQYHIWLILMNIIQILVQEVDINKIKLIQMEKKLRSLDRTTLIIKWNSLWTTDKLPIILVQDGFGQEDVFHPYCLHRDLIGNISNQYIVDFEIT